MNAAPTVDQRPAPTARPAPPAPPAAKSGAPGSAASQLARSAPPSGLAAKQSIDLPADVPAVAVDLVGGVDFAPPATVADYLAAKKGKAAPIHVRLGDVAAGTIKVKRSGKEYATESLQAVPLQIPWLAPLRSTGVEPVLAVRIRGGQLQGFASVVTRSAPASDVGEFLDAVDKGAAALGWLGIEKPKFGGIKNTLDGGRLIVSSSQLSFGIAKFLTASGTFALENAAFVFDATATGTIAKLGTVTVPIKGAADGSISGSAQVDVNVKGFTGQATVVFARGLVDVRGEIGYSNEKFDGRLTIIATDAASAKQIVAGQIPGQPAAPAAPGAGGAPSPAVASPDAPAAPDGPKPGKRVVAGWGKVNVRLAEWLSGDAMVVVDPDWHVTVVGTITPRMDKPLFPQKDFTMVLFAPPELRASYGLPVVGNVFLYANIVLTAEARLGPAVLKDMSMTGTWSTDPKVLQSFGLTGTLNISGFAGLRLKASGGAGIEILDHDIKAGISVWALAGIKGYVEATPRIGYREIADPQAGKKGEFFIGGHMELAARPFLELGGELYVELDSPWWSPAPDKRWPWPIGSLEYPLPGEFGIGADVEHVLGSGTIPEVKFGSVDFNSEKFLTDLVSDNVPPKTSGKGDKKGAWKEPAAPTPTPIAPVVPPPKVKGTSGTPPAAAKGKGKGTGAPKPRTPDEQKRWNAGVAAVVELARRSKTDPFTHDEIQTAFKSIRRKHKFTSLTATADGPVWHVRGAMSPDEPIADVALDPKDPKTHAEGSETDQAPEVPKELLPLKEGAPFVELKKGQPTSRFLVVRKLRYDAKLMAWFIDYSQARRQKSAIEGSLVAKTANQMNWRIISEQWDTTKFGQPKIDWLDTDQGVPTDARRRVRAVPLVATSYQSPSADPPGYGRLQDHRKWPRGHVLSGWLGGRGAAWNLVPISKDDNINVMERQFEADVKTAVAQGKQVKFVANVEPLTDADVSGFSRASDFPKSIDASIYDVSEPNKPTLIKHWPYDFERPTANDLKPGKLHGP